MGLYDSFVYKIRKEGISALSAESPSNTTFINYDIIVKMVYRDTHTLYEFSLHYSYERRPYD
jgi:hypothetical protein